MSSIPNHISIPLLTALLEHLGEPAFVEDETGAIIARTPALDDVFALSGETSADGVFESIASGSSDPSSLLTFRNISRRARTENQGHRLVTQQGEQVLCSYLPIVFDQNVRGHWWIFRTAAKAQGAADGMLPMDFLASMSHELRTPLNAIMGMSDLLQASQLSEGQREFVGIIQSNSDALLHLINDILDVSKIEAGQLDIEARAFDLGNLVESIAEILGLRAERKGVQLVLTVDSDVPRRVVGDINRLRQVLINLVGNAIKFTDDGRVTLRVFMPEPQRDGLAPLRFEIVDTGIGISEAEQARVFEKYYRSKSETVRRIAGTGLGLHITRRLVELMGGSVALSSALEQGTTILVDIALPVVATFTRQKTAGSLTRMIRRMRVLIADRDGVSRDALESMLTQRGFQVEYVDSGEAVFTAFAQASTPFDALVIDRDLPDLDGVHVARMLRANKEFHSVSVILLGSLAGHEEERLKLEGISAVIAKPIKESQLIRLLLKQLRLRGETVTALPAIPAPGTRGRILVAEDNPDNQTYARIVLEAAGCTVVLAENGREAVRLAGADSFDLVLMDVQMPVMDGLEAAAAIRIDERTKGRDRVPILALTGHAVEGFRDRVHASGMDDYLTKPVRRERLLEAIAEWLDVGPPSGQTPKVRIPEVDSEALVAIVDPDLMQLIPGYLDARKSDVALIRNHLDQSEFGEIRRIGHNLKGSGGGYGFPRISEIGATLEEAAAATDVQRVKEAVDALADYVSRVVIKPGDPVQRY